MVALPPRSERRRPRRGSLERPINARSYRGTWLLVAIPLLIAAFSVGKPSPLPPPSLPAAFDTAAAIGLAADLSGSFPDRRPGTPGAVGAAQWLDSELRNQGYTPQPDHFTARIPGEGAVSLDNIVAVAPGRSPEAIVVMAHRDDTGVGPGANDNASGTAALLVLARTYANLGGSTATPTKATSPAHTIVFLSTDAGSFGALGAAHFAAHSSYRSRVLAVVNLDSIAGRGKPGLQIAGDAPRSPPSSLVQTAAARIADQSGGARHPSVVAQFVDLAFPFNLYEQAPLVGDGIPAVTLTTAGDRPPSSLTDTPSRLDGGRLGQVGRAAQLLLGSLDQGLELARGSGSYVYLGQRFIPGWAIELVLMAALVPFLVVVVDLFAYCRRRRIRLAPAVRSYVRRLGFWAWVGLAFGLLTFAGAWPEGSPQPPNPGTPAADHWPVLGLVGLVALSIVGWLFARVRLVPRRPVGVGDELAGYAAALLALAVLALVTAATNPFALIFILPSIHAWLWLPQRRGRPGWERLVILLIGFAGPAILVGSMAMRFGLGSDAPWYLVELGALGYVPIPAMAIFLAWLAVAGQLGALELRRYAPYPSARERPRGPMRSVLRRALVSSSGRRNPDELAERRAARASHY
jgi:hypothetical protein